MRRLLVLLLLLAACASPPSGPTLEEAVQGGPRAFSVEGRWPAAVQARELLRAGRLEEAQALLATGAGEFAQDPAWLELQGDLAQRRGDFAGAARFYEACHERSGGSIPAFFRLYENYLLSRPADAVRVARQLLARVPRSPAAHLCLAEGLVFQAVVEDQSGAVLRKSLAEARHHAQQSLDLGPLGEKAGDPHATLGEIAVLEGEREQARVQFERALELGIPNRERAGDVANALGWLAVLRGDRPAAAAAWGRYLEILAGAGEVDSFRMLPKWEIAQYYRSVLAGAQVPTEELRRMEPTYAELRRQGVVEFEDTRATRELLYAVDGLRRAGRPGEALELLAPELAPEPADRDELAGVSCFFYFRVEEPLYSGMLHVLAGDLAAEAGDPSAARGYYDAAAGHLEGSPLLRERRAALR